MPRWRKPSWAIAVWTTVVALWLVTGIAGTADKASQSTAYAAGAGIAVFFILFVWVLILIPLALLWFGTRPRT